MKSEKEAKKQPSLHAGHRQRLRSRFLEQGAESLRDEQLLELLLFYAVPQRDTLPMAEALIQRFGSLSQVLCAPVEQLTEGKTVSENGAVLLRLVPELMRRCQESARPTVLTLEEAADYLWPYFEGLRQEHLLLLSIDEEGKPIACDQLAKGDERVVLVDVDRLTEQARFRQAAEVVMAHCHPSGFAIPSQADLTTTQQCRDRLERWGIVLRDHIIFADGDYLSMKESRLF